MKKVRVIYDPILRQRTLPVTVFNEQLKNLATSMLEIMHSHKGMGLAANQLGFDKDLLVLEYRPEKTDKEAKPIPPIALCNAKITKSSREKETMNEGCLSVPGLELPVERSSGVVVEANDLNGRKIVLKAKGLLARILQHEIDHLDGHLFTDRAKGIKVLKNYTWAKIVFFGSDDFSVQILKSLIESGLNVYAVITSPDKEAGRGKQLKSSPVRSFAIKHELAVFTPENKIELTEIMKQIEPDLGVLASFGMILPPESLEIPTYGILNVHPSILPKYRGATPIQSAILAGEKVTGVTIIKLDQQIDTGKIIKIQRIPLDPDVTTPSLKHLAGLTGAKLLIETIPLYLSGQAEPILQTGEPSITVKLTKEMGEIDWANSVELIDRQIRALNPWPGTFTKIKDKRLKIIEAIVVGGKLQLKTVQLEGKNPCSWADFKRGHAQELKKCSWFSKLA